MGILLVIAAYAVYAAFWIRFTMHGLVWLRAAQRLPPAAGEAPPPRAKACALTVLDVVLFNRLLRANGALWVGEWTFHTSFLLVLLRHLRFFLDPVPEFVWAVQTPGLIAAYFLPTSLVYILVVRLFTKHERYASPANAVLLALVLAISSLGLVMTLWFKPNLVDVKLFAVGLTVFRPAPAPASLLFALHFGLVLVLISLLPSHIFSAPLVMWEARKREQALHLVMHDGEKR